ncbi:MAG: RhuM family protein [Proteiniphilum sp.]|jgi:prophage maintenance system killer protein|uniref:RhuM family protein n=1 Tax=Proteiniphilum sp. TaxID=1926877 RepID=UPI002B212B6F|nr:RhuM family protein [Proteiniphilum sp.]MEA5128318.1 RhuM family protein [Proteiniphilum sp.]
MNKKELKVGDSQIVFYQTQDGRTNLDVKLEDETVWLTQAQMSELFQTTPQNITLHIGNIYKEAELEQISTCKDFLQVRQEGKRQVQRNVTHYNLDVIISVGYRVKSQRGTQFRIWANKILKDYLVKGYAVSERIKTKQYEELKQTVKLLANVIANKQELSGDEATGLLQVITDYTYALDTLDKYDYQQLTVERTTDGDKFHATYENAMEVIMGLKNKFGGSDLFGNEKDESFKSSINTIYQTFDSKELYPSIEEKAAMLLYLVTKNHSFSDGNKRIAAFLFLWFLEKNGILYKADGTKLIENNTLVALTLMIAESRTEEKDVMVKVVVNLINKNN